MAATQQSSGTVFQAWLPHPLDEQLRKQAESERRSRSQTIRLRGRGPASPEHRRGPAPLGGEPVSSRPGGAGTEAGGAPVAHNLDLAGKSIRTKPDRVPVEVTTFEC